MFGIIGDEILSGTTDNYFITITKESRDRDISVCSLAWLFRRRVSLEPNVSTAPASGAKGRPVVRLTTMPSTKPSTAPSPMAAPTLTCARV
jgi:hypothetical protein